MARDNWGFAGFYCKDGHEGRTLTLELSDESDETIELALSGGCFGRGEYSGHGAKSREKPLWIDGCSRPERQRQAGAGGN